MPPARPGWPSPRSCAPGMTPAVGRPEASTMVTPWARAASRAARVRGVISFWSLVRVPSRSRASTLISVFAIKSVSPSLFVVLSGSFIFYCTIKPRRCKERSAHFPEKRKKSRPVAGAGCRFENLFGQVAGVELVILALFGDQFVVAAALDDAALLQDDDAVGVADGGQPVGDDKGGAAVH